MRKFVIAIGAFAAGAACAQSQLKPGLWEISHKMQSSSGQMEQQMAQAKERMASMTPEQRKMMEEMMAQRGVKMGQGGPGGGMTVKVCMTKEMVERREMPTNRGECKTTKQSMSGNTMNVAFTCVNPPSSGEGQFTFNSPESYNMKMTAATASTAMDSPRPSAPL